LFGHPILSAVVTSTLPVAYLDWSGGRCPARTGDLPLDPSLSTAGVVTRLAPWLQGLQRARQDIHAANALPLWRPGDIIAVGLGRKLSSFGFDAGELGRSFVVKLNCPHGVRSMMNSRKARDDRVLSKILL
jgi:hypothetical protein